MSFDSMFQGAITALGDPLGIAFVIGSLVFLYVLWVAIRDSGPSDRDPSHGGPNDHREV